MRWAAVRRAIIDTIVGITPEVSPEIPFAWERHAQRAYGDRVVVVEPLSPPVWAGQTPGGIEIGAGGYSVDLEVAVLYSAGPYGADDESDPLWYSDGDLIADALIAGWANDYPQIRTVEPGVGTVLGLSADPEVGHDETVALTYSLTVIYDRRDP